MKLKLYNNIFMSGCPLEVKNCQTKKTKYEKRKRNVGFNNK